MPDALIQTFGRSHLVVLHLPIALVLVALLIEAFRLVRPRRLPRGAEPDAKFARTLRFTPSPTAFACVAFAAVTGAIAATSGWTYAGEEFTPGGDLEWHRWLGVVGASLAGLTLLLGGVAFLARARATARTYKAALFMCVIAIGWAGHLGGELVHGEGYVFEPLFDREEKTPANPGTPPDPGSPEDPERSVLATPAAPENTPAVSGVTPVALTFEADIKPIFTEYCVKCHREGKTKGGYRLDTQDLTLEAVTPGDAAASTLVRLVSLPESDENSMPKNKPALPPEHIETIKAWVNGLPAVKPGVHGPVTHEPLEVNRAPGPSIETPNAALAYRAADKPITLTPEQTLARDEAVERLRGRRISAGVRAEGLSGVEVRVFENRASFTGDRLDDFAGLEPCLTVLDLTGTSITDKVLARIAAGFPRIRILRIGDTAITDAGLASVASLTELALLDVHRTGVTEQGLAAVAASPSLRVIRCWRTQADEAHILDLSQRFQGVEFQHGG